MTKKQALIITLILLSALTTYAIFTTAQRDFIRFNQTRYDYMMMISPGIRHSFSLPLGEEQLSAIFPNLGIQSLNLWQATGYYCTEGTLLEIRATFGLYGQQTIITAGFEAIWYIYWQYGTPRRFNPRPSRIQGVDVTIFHLSSGHFGGTFFQADFTMDGLVYRIKHYNYRSKGRIAMTNILSQLISSGTEGWFAFPNQTSFDDYYQY